MIKFKLLEIEKSEFERLSNVDGTYFINGCIFDYDNDNLIAFPVYDRSDDQPISFFKILKEL